MKMTSQICVLRASRYNMTDKETGELVTGIKVTYVEDWVGQCKQNGSGVEVLSATMPYDDWDKFQSLPAMYEADFTLSAGARGKPMLRISDMRYVQPFSVSVAAKAKQ